MPLTIYATAEQLAQVLSQVGVAMRADDDDDEALDAGILDAVLEKATTDVNVYLLGRYSVATLAASTWVRWATAYLAVEALCRRRGNPVPEPIAEEANRYREELLRIRNGAPLITDDGLAIPEFDAGPTVSNLTIDGRHHRQKVRRVPATSSGGPQIGGLKQNNVVDTYRFFP